jgi:hypothetical protein
VNIPNAMGMHNMTQINLLLGAAINGEIHAQHPA